MYQIDAILRQVREADVPVDPQVERHVGLLISILESLDRGGLINALDWHRPADFGRAVVACEMLALSRLAALLRLVAGSPELAGHGGEGRIAEFDARYADYRERWDDVRAALTAKLAAPRPAGR